MKVRGLITKRQGKQNLTPHQQQLLASNQENQSIIIAQADKNLGPIGIDIKDYIKLGLEHLNTSTYEMLTRAQAARDIQELQEEIYSWTICHHCSLSDNVVNFIRNHLDDTADDPLGYFYLLIKLHKTPISGRPVCSDWGSLPHALGQWVDKTLQPIVQDQALYFKNLAELKSEMEQLDLPANISLFTYDTIAMYPNINTAQCIKRLSNYLTDPNISSRFGYSPVVLLDAIKLVMENNCMRFGDVIVKQVSRIAMGMSPAPTIANLFVAIYEKTHVLQYVPHVFLYLCCFINDGIDIWLHNPDLTIDKNNWLNFQACLNNSGLKWVFSKRSNEVVFMDLRLKIEGKKIVTSLFAKPMALHLYIPPHSCHALGVLLGIVFGIVLHIHQLCSRATDIVRELKLFFHRLLDRGYQSSQMTPLFQQAMDNAKNYLRRTALDHVRAKSRKDTAHCCHVFLHFPYHPANPSSKSIQKLWRDMVATPNGQTPLNCLTNQQG